MIADYDKYVEVAELLKVIAHPIRICIISGLIETGEANVTHMQTCVGTPQSTLSQHLQKLKAAGIVETRRNGLEIYYKVNNELVEKLMSILLK